MKNAPNYILFILLVGAALTISLSANGQESQNEIQIELEKTAKTINDTLPIMATDYTQFSSVTTGKMEIIFTYTFIKADISELDKDVFALENKKDILMASCAEMKPWLTKGVTARYIYLAKKGEIVGDTFIHHSDCEPKSSNSQKYQVFKGDGFSFRYPLSWEIGISQAETTKALIRTISDRSGYSANCNINTSIVEGTEKISQTGINQKNGRIHNLNYFSKITTLIPNAKITDYIANTYLSNQPASSVEFIGTINAYQVSTIQKFFQIVTIRKPKRYVITCRSSPSDYQKLTEAKDLIIRSFLITENVGNH